MIMYLLALVLYFFDAIIFLHVGFLVVYFPINLGEVQENVHVLV